MRDKFLKFMYGRYGVDEFGKCLLFAAVIVSVLSMLLIRIPLVSTLLSFFSIALMIYVIRRAFSRNINRRVMENHRFLGKTERIRTYVRFLRTRYNDRKVYRYVKCPNCKNYSRVPKGKGRIKITCRVCKKQFERKV